MLETVNLLPHFKNRNDRRKGPSRVDHGSSDATARKTTRGSPMNAEASVMARALFIYAFDTVTAILSFLLFQNAAAYPITCNTKNNRYSQTKSSIIFLPP